MADVEFAPQAGAAERHSSGFGTMMTVAGAILSLAFLTGISVWGYKLIMRDVSGVPVVRAIEGPMRVQPEDPGGEMADHLGLAVNAVAARGEAEATPDRLVLAPKPVDLTEDDKPLSVLADMREAVLQKASAQGEETDLPEDEVVDESAPDQLNEEQIAALVEELTKDVEPLDDLPQVEDVDWGEPLTEDKTAPAVDDRPTVSVETPGVRESVRPLQRPASLRRTAPTPQAQKPAAPVEVAEVDPDKLIAGTRLAQLGAFDSPEVARSEWTKLSSRFGDYLDGKSRVVQKASSGGRTFYRLRAMGFEDLSDARRFCSALVAEGADCIPVVTR